MKRGTAIRHLREVAEQSARHLEFATDDFPWPVVDAWIGGDLLERLDEVERVVTILRLDVPEDDLPELALTDAERAAAWSLDLEKRPMITRSRVAGRPAWSHRERRVARVWSREDGVDESNLGALADADPSGMAVEAPTVDELAAWLATELPRSEQHLGDVLDQYWDGSWRREHKGGGIYPDDHLWRAASAVQSMRDALAELDPRPAQPSTEPRRSAK